MLKKAKNIYQNLPYNKKVALILSISIFVITIILTFTFQIILKQSEMAVLDSMKSQFPNYVAAREDILNAFMGDRLNRYLSFLPLFAMIDFLINYYLISYVLTRFYSPLDEIFEHIRSEGDKLKKHITFRNKNIQEYNLFEDKYNKLISELNSAESNFEEFVQDATHEIKTPLFAIKTSLDVLNLKNKPSIGEYKNFEAIVEILTNRLIKMVDSLIILTKGKSDFEDNDEINISQSLEKTINLLKTKAESKHIKLNQNIEQNIGFKIQSRFIDSVFMNIVDNAIKYSNDQGKIMISLKKNADKILFECIDNGVGIPKGELKNIKQKFYRASNAIDEGIEGSGLGLSVVNKIVNEYGGNFEINSKGNMGVKVYITI